ncbi:hypothetical protein EPUS_08222 [Endocarpon pusillum Z07020]|uniref:C2H2-type domain-containing protein n=1 Tax=Endocarpon pusillum (strain Z07020 / HMAS-L-300199) TaxID=1263415 RepID=U1GJ88_ENDPU|nr:uncharacterized protein EPUS_08222 [Endocarpon pusillum Z07020]ERF71906.1 hypothetical protein EPUS_08222 [Endocarpon pusillum Z07020]
MAHSYAFNYIVSTVSKAFDPQNDPRVSAIVEEYRRTVDDHNKSPTWALHVKRRQAFAKLQRLHNEVKTRIKAEIIEHEDSSLFFDDDLDKQKIYWAVMQSHGELDPVNNSDSKQANSMDLRIIHDSLPQPEVKRKTPSLRLGTVKDNYRFCNHPGCDWKTELYIGSTYILQNHMITDHGKRLFPCRKGCPEAFRTGPSRQLHEISKHGNSAACQPSESETNEQAELDPEEDLTKIGGHNSTDVDMKDISEAVSNDNDGLNKECYQEINIENALDVGYKPAANLGEDATAVDPIHSTAATTEDAVGIKKLSTTSDGSFHYCTHPGCPWKIRVHKNAYSTIRKHIRTKHLGIRYSCQAPGCDISYISNSDRRRHELEKHGIVAAKPEQSTILVQRRDVSSLSSLHLTAMSMHAVCIVRVE